MAKILKFLAPPKRRTRKKVNPTLQVSDDSAEIAKRIRSAFTQEELDEIAAELDAMEDDDVSIH